MQNHVKTKINEENCKPFENWRKVIKLWIITLTSAQETKQTSKVIY